ncbi:MAG: LysR family transcriptional regulator [Pseudolabrys sp.]
MDFIQSIGVFVKVAETGSFTDAAKVLDMSPSGVSKSLRRLEEKLKVRLVTRTTRSVHLTEEGGMLVEQFRQILSDIDQVEVLLADRLARPNGRLRIQVPVAWAAASSFP